MVFLQLFIAFFAIGLFGFGGEYAMVSLLLAQSVSTLPPIVVIQPYNKPVILTCLPWLVLSQQPLLWSSLRSC